MKYDLKKGRIPLIKTFSTAATWGLCFTSPRVFVEMVSYVRTVIRDFFLIQFARKFKFTKTPIVSVDNPLDDRVPFAPVKVGDYLGFVNYWIRPLAMLIKVLGRRKAVPYVAEFFNLIKKTYREAAGVYRCCMTTTRRPRYYKTIYFAAIHILDPHLLCVPSLHIAVITLTWTYFREVFKKEGFSEEQQALWNGELYRGALVIAETVLYIKQHSVNCIAAAMYMMYRITGDLCSKNDALQFLDCMFLEQKDIQPEDRKEIIYYMKSLFERFYAEGKNSPDWSEPVKKFLLAF